LILSLDGLRFFFFPFENIRGIASDNEVKEELHCNFSMLRFFSDAVEDGDSINLNLFFLVLVEYGLAE
jgi:hypothetical protein